MISFTEQHFCDEYWHWPYSFSFDCEILDYHCVIEELYNWCLYNLNDIGGWHVRGEGVIILKEEDAMAFKLRWI